MTRVEFKKTFTKGILSGITVSDRMSCTGMQEALDWVDRVNENTRKGYLEYFIHELRYVEVFDEPYQLSGKTASIR